LKYIFMGSPPLAATILEHLCAELYPPTLVVSQIARAAGRGKTLQPTAVETLARAKGLPVLTTENINASAEMEKLRGEKPDLILVAAFGQLLKEPLLSLPRLYCLNVHASLLPKYRGAGPVQWAIWNGESETGITIQRMVKKLDAGDIFLQKSISISPEWTSVELLENLAGLGASCLVEAVKLTEKGYAEFTPQDSSKVTFAPKIDRTHAIIDWSRSAQEILNQIRALQPWPVAESRMGEERVKIFAATVESVVSGADPGTIFTDAKSYLSVKCGDLRALSLTEIQLENRKRLKIEDFLRAYRGAFPYQQMGAGNPIK
jgi:methionyl-tRNA formyltransferase